MREPAFSAGPGPALADNADAMTNETDPKPDTPPEAQPPATTGTDRRRDMTPTPHDAFFRAVVADPDRARDLLRAQLPDDITGQLADTRPEIVEGTFVDETLRGSQSDLLMQVETKTGHPAFVYVLVEHKSTPDPGVVLQVASYMIRIWQRHAQGQAARLQALPPIIPLVGYSGSAPWTVPTRLSKMIKTNDPEDPEDSTLKFMNMKVILRQWAQMPPEALSRNAEVQAVLLTLTRRAFKFLPLVVAGFADNPLLQRQMIEYIMRTYPDVGLDDLIDRLSVAGADEMEGLVGTIAETLEARGEARGITKGMAEGEARGIAKGEARGIAMGKAEGRKQDLTRLLERRFGPLPRDVRDRITGAGHDQLDRWLDRVLDARSLGAVFGD